MEKLKIGDKGRGGEGGGEVKGGLGTRGEVVKEGGEP